MASKLELLAAVLEDGQWHTNLELVEKVGHRFGGQLLQLRKGEFGDGLCWVVETERTARADWRYRLVDFQDSYAPNSPCCPNCGTKLHIHDIRQAA